MKVAQRIAEKLRVAKDEHALSTAELVRRTGLTAVSIRAALTGDKDSRLSTVIALAHELELDLVLVPTAVSASIAPPSAPAPQVKTLVDAVRERNAQAHQAPARRLIFRKRAGATEKDKE